MRTYAPVQFNTLAKTAVFVFIALSILWGVTNYVFMREIYLHWVILAINGVLALVLGWRFYKNGRHAVFSYDKDSFEIQVGRREASGRWRDFSNVSLLHLGYGMFAVRLYKDEKASVEIPASALKLDASAFRFEVMGLTQGEPLVEK